MANTTEHTEATRVLLVCGPAEAASTSRAINDDRTHIDAVLSLTELVKADLHCFDLVLVAMDLEDGTGIDALGFIRSAAPDLPVILTMDCPDTWLAREAVACGAMDCIVKDAGFLTRLPVVIERTLARCEQVHETQQLQRGLNDSLVDLIDEVSSLQKMINQLETIAVTDELTGLHNRRRLNTAIGECWDTTNTSIACLMIDLDHFKKVNDKLGHQQGDALLCMLGRVLRAHTRSSDIVTRYGGDEFCVLMANVSLEDATTTAHRIAEVFAREASRLIGEVEWTPGVSIGIAHTDVDRPETALELVGHADEAMYIAKRDCRGVMVREPDHREPAPTCGRPSSAP